MTLLIGAAAGCSSASGTTRAAAAPPTGRAASTPSPAGPGGSLQAPKTTPLQDTRYLSDLARTDPSLESYVNANGDVALKALITDGSAFCAFLQRDGTIDDAMTSVAIGANGVESETHLPMSVQTFNAMDAVALIDLCPTEQKLLPPASRQHVQALQKSLG